MASPQSSRAGLITTIVILAMFGLGVLIWGITENAGRRSAEEATLTAQAKYDSFAAKNSTALGEVENLKAQKASLGLAPTATVMDVINKRDYLAAQIIDEKASSVDEASTYAKQETANALEALRSVGALDKDSAAAQTDISITGLVRELSNTLQNQQALAQSLQTKLDQANATIKSDQEAFTAAKGELGNQVDQARKDADKAKTDAAAAIADAQTQLKQAQDDESKTKADDAKAADTLTVENTRLDGVVKQKDAQLKVVMDKLKSSRPQPGDNILRQADGVITRVPEANIVYINLGMGDHISDGLTFEVYNATDGIPSLANNEDALPIGKASIEVIAIGQNTSKCRVITLAAGQQLVEGDLIANLVYDKNTTYNFMIYGNFDVAHTGTPKPEDAEVLKRLVTTWGGKVDAVSPDKPEQAVNIDTDFLVLGEEPVVPSVPADDADAGENANYYKKQDEWTKYEAVLSAAKELGIPVLNQNRFLYFIGYYDLVTR